MLEIIIIIRIITTEGIRNPVAKEESCATPACAITNKFGEMADKINKIKMSSIFFILVSMINLFLNKKNGLNHKPILLCDMTSYFANIPVSIPIFSSNFFPIILTLSPLK